MAPEDQIIFRKNSLEKIASPEKLNEYIKIINPLFMIVLAVVFFVITIIGYNFFISSVPKYMNISGIAIASTDNSDEKNINKIYSYVNLSVLNNLELNMPVSICLEYAPKEEFGYINGRITSIGEEIITNSYLNKKFENPEILEPILPKNHNCIEIEITLDDLTNKKNKNIKIINGSLCNISITVSKLKIYEVIGL